MAQTTPEQHFARFRQTGEAGAFAAFYDATVEEVLGTALRLAKGPAEAEDLVQATYLGALAAAERFDASRRVVPWLVGICTNQARKLRRSGARTPDALRLRAERPVDPRDEAERSELRQTLTATIDALPQVYRPVLVLSLVNELTPTEIAHALGRPPVTVRSQLYRGLEMLREALPKGLALGALAWLLPTRGMAAVKSAVVAQAAAPAGTALAAGAALGGILLMKKTLACVALSAVAVVAWVAWPDSGGAGAEERQARKAQAAPAGVAALAASAPATAATAAVRVPVGPDPAAGTGRLGNARLRLVWASDGSAAAWIRGHAREQERPNGRAHEREITSDGSGLVALDGLWPGALALELDRCRLGVRIVAGGTVEETLPIPAGMRVTVKVVDERRVGIPSAEVWISDGVSNVDGCAAGTTALDGTLELCDVEPERNLGARAPGYQPTLTDRVPGHAGDSVVQELVLRAGGASLRGVVRLPSGQPCAGALVRIEARSCSQKDALGNILPPPGAVTVRTDDRGGFATAGVALGTLHVAARALGFGGVMRILTLQPNEAGVVELTLTDARALQGTVRDDLGKPIVANLRAWSGSPDSFARSEATSDADGRFRLDDVPAGEVTVIALNNGRNSALRKLGPEWTADTPVALVLETTRAEDGVTGVLVDEAGRPLAGWFLGLAPEGAWNATYCVTDANGAFRFERTGPGPQLGPGPLQLTVHGEVHHSPNRSSRQGNFVLQSQRGIARGTRDLRIVVPNAARAFGAARLRAVGASGEPQAWLELLVDRAGETTVRKAQTDANGDAEIAELPPGEYRLRLRDARLGTVRLGKHRVAVGATTDLGEVRVAAAATLRARVRRADGKPFELATANVYDAEGELVASEHVRDPGHDLVLGPLAPGDHVAIVMGEDLACTRFPFRVGAGEAARVEWVVPRGVECRVELHGLKPGTAVTTVLHDAASAVLANVEREAVVEAVQERTWFLVPGTYTATFRDTAGRSARQQFSVDAAAKAPVRARCELR